MYLKKLVFIIVSILFLIKPFEATSQDLIINKNMDSIHCKILAVKGKYYYYKTFLELSSQVKFIHIYDIRDTIRNYYPYDYNRDSALIVSRYFFLKKSKRQEIKASKISLNYGAATISNIPNNFSLFRSLFQVIGMPYMNNYYGINYSKTFYKNFGLTTSISNINSDKNSQLKIFNGITQEIIPVSMQLNNWNYTLGLTYISTQKRFPKFSWQFNSELGYYQFKSIVDYIIKYEINSDALLWRNSGIIEYNAFKNFGIGFCGFIQLSNNKVYEYNSSGSNFEKENPKGAYKYHTYIGTTLSLSYLLFDK